MRTLVTILLIITAAVTEGQTVSNQQLIDTATKSSGLFINAKPLTLSLDKNRIFLYNEWLYDQKKVRLPDSTYIQFINNSKKPDTSYWTDQELPSFIIVKGKYSLIDSNYVLTKFASFDSVANKRHLSQISKYNKTSPQNRRVFFFSRPVFDNSRSYAVVQYDNGHSWLMGGGGIKLYHLEEGIWREMALLVRWSY